MLIRNKDKTVLITKVWPPDCGSTILAIDNPAVDAIFSPLTEAAEKRIFKIKPTDKPKPISARIIINILKTLISIKLGSFIVWKIKNVIHIDKTILTWRGIKLVEKKGILINNALILREEKKKVRTNWYKFVKSSPGKTNAFIIILFKSQHLKFDQI